MTTVQKDLETLAPSAEVREFVIGVEGKDRYQATYVQRPLSYFGKLDLYARLAQALEDAMNGPDGISLRDILEGVKPEQRTAANPLGMGFEDLASADGFVRAVSKLVAMSPDLMQDLYCTILSVPRPDREWAKSAMAMPTDEGGLSDDDGFAILELFFAQNGEVIKAFFIERLGPMVSRIRGTNSEAPASAPSKRSKPTRPTTPKE